MPLFWGLWFGIGTTSDGISNLEESINYGAEGRGFLGHPHSFASHTLQIIESSLLIYSINLPTCSFYKHLRKFSSSKPCLLFPISFGKQRSPWRSRLGPLSFVLAPSHFSCHISEKKKFKREHAFLLCFPTFYITFDQ